VRRYVKFRVKWRTLWMVSAGERRDEVSGGRLPLGFSGGWPNKQPLTANPLTNLALHCPVGQISMRSSDDFYGAVKIRLAWIAHGIGSFMEYYLK
jgi:hypothetical protein